MLKSGAILSSKLSKGLFGDESLLTNWWPMFWDKYCATTREDSRPSSSSLVQPGNAMGNAQQSIHGKAPVVIDQPVPLGADMDTMLITGQQPAAHLMASNNYQGQQPTEQGQGQEPAPPLFEIQAAEVNQDGIWRELEHQEQAAPTRPQAQRVAQAQDQGQAQAQTITRAEALVRAEGYREARERALEEAREAEAKAKDNRMTLAIAGAIEKLQAGPSTTKVRSRGRSSTVAAQTQHQGNRVGASRGRSIAPGNEASTGANNYQGQQPAEAPAQGQAQRLAQGQGLAQRIARAAQELIQAEADREARSQARAIQAGASSTNVRSQQVRSLTVAAQTQHQVPPRGNRDGASQGRSIAPGNEASTGANQQRSEEADVSEELGSRSKKKRLN